MMRHLASLRLTAALVDVTAGGGVYTEAFDQFDQHLLKGGAVERIAGLG